MADDASPNLSREPATVRVAMWSARHRWPVFAGWFIATIGLFVLSQSMGGIKADDPNGNPNEAQTESAKAYTVFGAGGENVPTEDVTIVVTHPSLKVTDPAYQAFVAGIVTRFKGLTVTDGGATVPVFDEVQDPATATPEAGLISSDLSTARVSGRITGDQDKVERYLVPVRDAITAIESDSQGFTVHSISQTLTSQDITNLINEGLDRTFITIGLTFIILLITFGALVASVIPLVLAVSALLAAFGILGIFSQLVTPVSPYATQLVVLIGLAVSVDYSLFMITRFRSERREAKSKMLAIETAAAPPARPCSSAVWR
jgi:RND superfamily putative drug exporter